MRDVEKHAILWSVVLTTVSLSSGCAGPVERSVAPTPGSATPVATLLLPAPDVAGTRTRVMPDASRASSDERPEAPTAVLVAAGMEALEAKRRKLESRGPKSFDKPQEAMEFHVRQRLAAGADRLPIAQLEAERDRLRQREARVASQALSVPPGGVLGWSWLGPGNIGGRTRALVIDPGDPDVMYAAGVAGGVWKSTNAGASWNATDDLMLNLAVTCIAMDPTDSSVLYAGTGEGFYGSSTFVQGLGMFKSVDAGATWAQLPGTVGDSVPEGSFHYVNKIVVSPNDNARLYAGTRTGVWRSSDAGANWTLVLANPFYLTASANSNGSLVGCTELVIRQDSAPDVLFAAYGSFMADGLFRSLDGGNSWQAYTVPANQGRMTIALAPSDNDIIYLLMADNGGVGATGQIVDLYRSDDGGNSFVNRIDFGTLTGPWLLSNLILATGCLPGGTYSQGWYDNIVAVDPVDPDVVWVGGVDIFRSDDGGQTFGIPGYWIFYTIDPPPPYQIHPDHHTIVFHPDYDGVSNQTMFVGNDGGLYRTQNARAATSQEDCPLPGTLPLPAVVWERLNNNYGVTQFYHGDSAVVADVFVGGAQDNGSLRVEAQGTPNDWDLVFGGDGGYVAIDPTDPQVIYVEYQFFPTIQKSTDGGETFADATNGITDTDGGFIAPFAMDQADPDVLWTGGSRPWRTKDAATSWQPAGFDFPGASTLSAIAIAPSDSDVVYLGFENGYVVRTTNGLGAFPVWTVPAAPAVNGWISSLAVDPLDPDKVYATTSNYGLTHILGSVDGGLTWTSLDGIGFEGVPDIPVHWIAVRPCNRDQLYVGTELGVFVSDDRGGSWTPVNTGLANVVVESLDFRDEDTLVAFTHGRGAFLATLEPCAPQIEGSMSGSRPQKKAAP